MHIPVRRLLATVVLSVVAVAGVLAGSPRAVEPVAAASRALEVPVLMYHYIRVNPDPRDVLGRHLSVSPETFSLQMALLRRSGFTAVTMHQVADSLDGSTGLPPRPIAITFDDGYADVASIATPVLRHLGLAGTAYLVPGFVGRPGYVTRPQVDGLVTEGMEIGAHTMHHDDLPTLSPGDQEATIRSSREVLRTWTGQRVDSFAYPFGHRDAAALGAVSRAGFRTATTTDPGRLLSADARLSLPRVRVDGDDGLTGFAAHLGVPLPPSSDRAWWQGLQATADQARHGGIVAALPGADGRGYGLVDADGRIHAFGSFTDAGSLVGMHLNRALVGGAARHQGGYWLLGGDGGVFPFGGAPGHGSLGAVRLNAPVIAMAATPSGEGYWLVAADGGVFPFGDARGFGSLGGRHLNRPIVAMVATPDGGGYWLMALDGGVFPFGNAVGHGSLGATRLNQPVVAAGGTTTGRGYWLVAADGGVFPFGDAQGWGSLGNARLNEPITAFAASSSGGYWLVARDGGVFPFGGAVGAGSAA